MPCGMGFENSNLTFSRLLPPLHCPLSSVCVCGCSSCYAYLLLAFWNRKSEETLFCKLPWLWHLDRSHREGTDGGSDLRMESHAHVSVGTDLETVPLPC